MVLCYHACVCRFYSLFIRAKKKAEVLRGDVRGLIIPALREIRQEIVGSLDSLRQQVLAVQDDIEESGSLRSFRLNHS